MTRRAATFLSIFLLLSLLSAPVHANHYRVVTIVDGDSITVEPSQGGDRIKISLYGIDAPELRQPYGHAARVFVYNAVLFKEVDIQPVNIDRYGRTVAVVNIPGVGILQELLLSEGLAWVYPQYCKRKKICEQYRRLEADAREKRKGLWGGADPVPPWEWRHGKKR